MVNDYLQDYGLIFNTCIIIISKISVVNTVVKNHQIEKITPVAKLFAAVH